MRRSAVLLIKVYSSFRRSVSFTSVALKPGIEQTRAVVAEVIDLELAK